VFIAFFPLCIPLRYSFLRFYGGFSIAMFFFSEGIHLPTSPRPILQLPVGHAPGPRMMVVWDLGNPTCLRLVIVWSCLIMFDHVARSMEEYQWCSSWQLGHGIVKRMSILEMTNLEVGAVGGPCSRWWRLLRHSRVGPGDFVVVWCGSTPQTESKDRIYCKSVIGFKWFTVSWLLV